MRDIPAGLAAKLGAGATTLCRCWLLERTDGVAMGFTDHDSDLTFEGHVFAAGTGLEAGAIESSTGLSVDNAQAVGALTSTGLSEADIAAGRYDEAVIRHWLVDWTSPDSNRVLVFRGGLGEITRGNSAFEVELRGAAEDLNRTVGRTYLPTCDRVLGDAACGFDTSQPGFFFEGIVGDVRSQRSFSSYGASSFAEDWFAFGALVWTSGENAGLSGIVKRDFAETPFRVFDLWQQAARSISPGDGFRVIAGCDKAAVTCRKKFDNFLNFRGFPSMPGEDWVTAYPANDGAHDGGRRGDE